MELRNDVESKIKSGVYKSMPNSNDKLSTLLWSVFDLISREDGSPIDGLVCCKRCQKVFRYDKKCTKNLTSHACFPILSSTKDDTGEETFHHVADKLKSGEYKLIQRTNGRSPVWSVFAQIQRSDGSIVKTAVHCCQCKKFYRYHSGQVSNLGRHKCVQLWKLQESMTKRRRTEEDNDLHVGSIFSEDSNISMEKEYEDEEEGEGEETTMDTTFNCVKEEFKESEFNDYNVLIGHNEETYPMDDGSLLRVINAVKEDEHHEETAYQSQSSPAPETDKECTLTRDILEENLRSGKYKLIEKPKARSSVWKMFSAIAKEDGSIIEQWVYCRRCKKVYRNSEKRASSNLIRHNCCNIVLKKISANDRKEIIEDFANWMIEDTQSVTVFEGGGFRKLAEKFIKIGARYGVDMDVNDLMPSPTAVSQSISQKAAEQKSEVKRKIEEFTRYATVSVDFWTDNNISRHFLSATLHYVRNFHVYTLALGVKSMDNTTTSNETTTQKKLMKLLSEFGIDDTTDLLFVVESRTNVEIGLEDRDTLKCSSSLFAQALDKAIQDTPHISEMFTACKAIEKYFRKSSEQTSLLKSEANTRCKSQYRLFKLIASNWQTVKTSLESINIAKTSTFSLPALVDLLQKCEIIFNKLQEKHKPTLCYVIPSINRLKIICKATTDDSPQMKALKANLLLNLEEIWLKNINIWHKTAYFLYPPTNRAQENNLNEIRDFCIKQMNVFGSTSKDDEESASTTTTTSYCEYESADIANNPNTDDIDFFFPDIPKRCRLTNNKTNNVEEEFRRYCLETVLIDANFDVCQWWRVNAPYYPLLSRLFSKISSIPASTTGTQYMYAVTAKIAEEKHRGLKHKNMEDIMFLNSIKPNKI